MLKPIARMLVWQYLQKRTGWRIFEIDQAAA